MTTNRLKKKITIRKNNQKKISLIISQLNMKEQNWIKKNKKPNPS
jgi:hypothetical protein